MPENMVLSVVIPLYNEEESLPKLVSRLVPVLRDCDCRYEILLVDDGSEDGTWSAIEELKRVVPEIRGIKLRRNCGQTAAMAAGFDLAKGDVIVTLDGDLQNDPEDIPRLLAQLGEGYDVVSGWRKDRKDHWSRVLPSKVANWVISKTTGVSLHDCGCSLKAYRGNCLKSLQPYGDMHRFFPALASMTGAKVTELPVGHAPRIYGVSKYGFSRIWKVFLDLLAMNLIVQFSSKPLKGFVYLALPFVMLSVAFGSLGLGAWWLSWSEGKAIFFLAAAVLNFLGALTLVALGVLAELAVFTSDLTHTQLVEVTRQVTVIEVPQEVRTQAIETGDPEVATL